MYDFGHFTTISGQFFTTFKNISHKTEVQTVILRCLTSLNLNWIKSYDKNDKTLTTVFFNFGRKKTENLSFKNVHF